MSDLDEYKMLEGVMIILLKVPRDIRSQNHTAYLNEVEARFYDLHAKYSEPEEDFNDYPFGISKIE